MLCVSVPRTHIKGQLRRGLTSVSLLPISRPALTFLAARLSTAQKHTSPGKHTSTMRLSARISALGASLGLFTAAYADDLGPDADGLYWIKSDDLQLGFIPYGAAVSRLLINDQYGIQRDIVGGWDNASYYEVDKQHPHFGSVPGRYANRIKNSTFEIDGVSYKVDANENGGLDTLHGGSDGWDYRNFTVQAHTDDSITFSIVDPDGKEGFPGEVVSYITYTVTNLTWDFKMIALATTKKTPIMLSSHTYWNLDGFANNETNTVFNHTFYLPYSGQRVDVDNILIPTGDIRANQQGSVNDFWSAPKQIGSSFGDSELEGNCGYNCTGYGEFLIPPHTPASCSSLYADMSDRYLLSREPCPGRPLRLAN